MWMLARVAHFTGALLLIGFGRAARPSHRGPGLVAFGGREVVAAVDAAQLAAQPPHGPVPFGPGQARAAGLLGDHAVFSPARAAAIPAASSRSWAVVAGRASQTVAGPPASVISSAIQSTCSRVRASAGSATRPSPSWATPRRLSLRQLVIRGVGLPGDPVGRQHPLTRAVLVWTSRHVTM